MLHKVVDFTQTILGTVALTGIIALSVITVNALNPSIKNSTAPQVAGVSTLPKETNALPVQFTDSLNDSSFRGHLQYVSDTKSVYKLEVSNLTQIKEFNFLNVENINNFSSSFNISVFIPQQVAKKVNVQLLDNINTLALTGENRVIQLKAIESKSLKLKLSPEVGINFPFELEFDITQ